MCAVCSSYILCCSQLNFSLLVTFKFQSLSCTFKVNSSKVECSCSIIFSHSQLHQKKCDLVVSEVQMILVSHSLWNLSFYHGPLPSPSHSPSLFPFLSTSCAILLLSFSHLWLPFALSSLFPYLSYHLLHSSSFSICPHPSLVSAITPRPLSPPFSFNFFHSVASTPWHYYILLLPQVMWMQVKARWWATCFICWATSTSAPCTNTSRNQRRRERPLSPMLGSWMRLARRGTGTCWAGSATQTLTKIYTDGKILCTPPHWGSGATDWQRLLPNADANCNLFLLCALVDKHISRVTR